MLGDVSLCGYWNSIPYETLLTGHATFDVDPDRATPHATGLIILPAPGSFVFCSERQINRYPNTPTSPARPHRRPSNAQHPDQTNQTSHIICTHPQTRIRQPLVERSRRWHSTSCYCCSPWLFRGSAAHLRVQVRIDDHWKQHFFFLCIYC